MATAGSGRNTPSMDYEGQGTMFDGGFEVDMFLDEITDHQRCSYCRNVLRAPRQRRCGHLFCKTCFERLCRESVTQTSEPHYCPSCIMEETIDEESIISADDVGTKDYAMSRVLANKKVKCPQVQCSFQGTLRDYEGDHELNCPYATIDCPRGCGQSVHISLLKNHMEHQCRERKILCQYCQQEFPFRMEETHKRTCPNQPASCELCGKNVIRDQLAHHMDVECEFFKCTLGCNEKIPRTKMAEHYADQSMALNHLAYVGRNFNEMKQTVIDLKNKAADKNAEAESVTSDNVAEIVETIAKLDQQVSTLDNLCSVFKVEFHKLFDSALVNKQRTDQMSELQQNMQERMQRLEQAVQIRDVQLMERDLRLKALEEVSFDGTLAWRVENFSECRRKAQSGEMTSIYSPAFYTSRCGYKMCARLYLNGDGIGKGTHISFFFVVMRGKYDGLLRWPFQQKVTMMLLDYTGQHHIMDAFRPDSTSASFHKPKNEMNVASGCPLFMPLSSLQEKITNHVKDDVAYFKIIVDCSDIPY